MFALESLLGAGGNMVVSIYRRFAEFISGGHWWRFHSLALFPFVFSLRSNWYSHLLSKISFARCSRDWAVGCKNTLASLWSPEVNKKNINILNTLTHTSYQKMRRNKSQFIPFGYRDRMLYILYQKKYIWKKYYPYHSPLRPKSLWRGYRTPVIHWRRKELTGFNL